MGKHKSDGKKTKKGSQFVIRLDKDERDAFVTLCEDLDTTASREIRRFMREWVAAHANKGSAIGAAPEPAMAMPVLPEPVLAVPEPSSAPIGADASSASPEVTASSEATPAPDQAITAEVAPTAKPKARRKSAAL